ncbi:MAG: hypothetical protein AAFZ07_00920 [Actinomycetota bacterium]
MNFDPNIPGYMEGEITSVVTGPSPWAGIGGMPNLVIDRSEPFTVAVDWEVHGLLKPLWLAALADNWRVRVFAESLGGGPEVQIAEDTVPKSSEVACTAYGGPDPCGRFSATLTVPANTLPEDAGAARSGVYKLVTTVFLNSTLGEPGFDVIGFHEGPIIQVENPV